MVDEYFNDSTGEGDEGEDGLADSIVAAAKLTKVDSELFGGEGLDVTPDTPVPDSEEVSEVDSTPVGRKPTGQADDLEKDGQQPKVRQNLRAYKKMGRRKPSAHCDFWVEASGFSLVKQRLVAVALATAVCTTHYPGLKPFNLRLPFRRVKLGAPPLVRIPVRLRDRADFHFRVHVIAGRL